jgi:hypothetical protein
MTKSSVSGTKFYTFENLTAFYSMYFAPTRLKENLPFLRQNVHFSGGILTPLGYPADLSEPADAPNL